MQVIQRANNNAYGETAAVIPAAAGVTITEAASLLNPLAEQVPQQ
jgi:hypothetical protein